MSLSEGKLSITKGPCLSAERSGSCGVGFGGFVRGPIGRKSKLFGPLPPDPPKVQLHTSLRTSARTYRLSSECELQVNLHQLAHERLPSRAPRVQFARCFPDDIRPCGDNCFRDRVDITAQRTVLLGDVKLANQDGNDSVFPIIAEQSTDVHLLREDLRIKIPTTGLIRFVSTLHTSVAQNV